MEITAMTRIQRNAIFYFIILFITLLVSSPAAADVELFLDPAYSDPGETPLKLSVQTLGDPGFPPPQHHQPVLFVHGHNLEPVGSEKNFIKNWQSPLYGLTSFLDTLHHAENANLNLEAYFLDLEDYSTLAEKQNRTIEDDAARIAEAVDLILIRHGDPTARKTKVVIIAYSKGTISTRYYLKNLWESHNRDLSFHPVSEFIAISPPNHGLNATSAFIQNQGDNCICLKQLNNGYQLIGSQFQDSRSHHFIEKLNGHPIGDTHSNSCVSGIFETEAPAARSNNEPVQKGILYVTLYAGGNRDIVGGGSASNDKMGRVMAKNLAPKAVNLEIPGIGNDPRYPSIPGGSDKGDVHRHTVHMPEVICKALYTAVHHVAPPDELRFEFCEPGNRTGPPRIPLQPLPPKEKGVVLLLDISGSMAWAHDGTRDIPYNRQRLSLAKQAVKPFMELLNLHYNKSLNAGVAIFPPLPGSYSSGCDGQVIAPLTLLTDRFNTDTFKTVDCLSAQGSTPLLKGLSNAVDMFGPEKQKTIILLSDGFHNCPARVDAASAAVNNLLTRLNRDNVTLYAIGFGRQVEVDRPLLTALAENRPPELKGKFLHLPEAGYNPDSPDSWDAATALNETYKSIFTDALQLEEIRDPMGIIHAGDNIAVSPGIKINPNDTQISFLLTWADAEAGSLNFSLKSSDGKHLPIPASGDETPGFIRVRQGETYKIITVGETFLSMPGKVTAAPWQMFLDASGLNSGQSVKYQYCVLPRSSLKMKTAIKGSAHQTGDTITVSASLMEGEAPVTGLKSVSATVTGPGDGRGNWFAAHRVSTEELQSVPESIENESLSPLHRKSLFLTQTRKVPLPHPTAPLSLPLYDDGSHGDARPNDGIYTNQFTDTAKEGIYSFYFRAEGDTFQREKKEQTYVSVKSAPEFSPVTVRWVDTFKRDHLLYVYDVGITPMDQMGNHAGPGRTASVSIIRENGSSEPIPLEDMLNGTYSGQIEIPKSAVVRGARLQLNLDGTPFYTVTKLPRFHRWFAGIRGGLGVPLGSFTWNHDPGITFGGHLGYRLAPQFSLVSTLGYSRFNAASPQFNDLGWWNLSLNLRSEIRTTPVNFYFEAGPGIYIHESGTFQNGINAGGGVSYSFNSWGIDLGLDYHHILKKGTNTEYMLYYIRLNYEL
jgi:hypothetical protein